MGRNFNEVEQARLRDVLTRAPDAVRTERAPLEALDTSRPAF